MGTHSKADIEGKIVTYGEIVLERLIEKTKEMEQDTERIKQDTERIKEQHEKRMEALNESWQERNNKIEASIRESEKMRMISLICSFAAIIISLLRFIV